MSMTVRKVTCHLISGIVFAVLAGCGGGGGSSSQQDHIKFSTFPEGYFSGSYSASYSLTGSYSNGEKVTGTLNVQSGTVSTFNSLEVSAINQHLSFTNSTTGATSEGIIENYYSPGTDYHHLEGSYDVINGVTSVANNPGGIWQMVDTGSFGAMGWYTRTDGGSAYINWSIKDAYNGNAKYVETSEVSYGLNPIYLTEIYSWEIAPNGTRVAVEITIIHHQSDGLTLTLSGNKN